MAGFSRYQTFVIGVLTFIQFTVILDFMILSPLGAMLMPALGLTPTQFGAVISVYAISAGLSGILAAGFADRYDRKSWLLFFYVGFVLGTLFCGLAPSYPTLLAARLVTGLFGGVLGSIVYSIITDLFPVEMRGRVMGFIQTAFAASQILGIPLSLFLANLWGWQAPFLLIVAISGCVGVVIWRGLKPMREHLRPQFSRQEMGAFHHLWATLQNPRYLYAFASTALLSTGGFMIMPFGSAFTVNNLKIALADLPQIYLVTGLSAMLIGPFIGRMSDRHGPLRIFTAGSAITLVMILIHTRLGETPLWLATLISVVLFVGISARIISSGALLTSVPSIESRGAFMSVNSSIQQFSGGIASMIAGWVVVQSSATSPLQHFDTLGNIVAGTTIITVIMFFGIQRMVSQPSKSHPTPSRQSPPRKRLGS